MTIVELLRQFLEITYHVTLIGFYFAYFLIKGRENDPLTYPSLSCIDDRHSTAATGSPIPFGSPMAATTNVCCLHGIQSKPPTRISPPAITAGPENEKFPHNTSGDGWLSKFFHFMKWEEKVAESSSIQAPAIILNGCSEEEPHNQRDSDQSWMSKALKRYVNMENMPKIPEFLAARQPSQESETESIYESTRSTRILKVTTESSSQKLPIMEQRPGSHSISVKPTKIPPPVPPKNIKITENYLDQLQKITQSHRETKFLSSKRESTPVPVPPPPPVPRPSLVHIRVKPTFPVAKSDSTEEETDSTDEEVIMEQKLKLATIISVPTVVQHRGATTVHMHLKRHEMSMIQMASDDDEQASPRQRAVSPRKMVSPVERAFSPRQRDEKAISPLKKDEKVPIIVIEEEKETEDVELPGDPCDIPVETMVPLEVPIEPPTVPHEISELPSPPDGHETPRIFDVDAQNFIPDEIWLLPFPQENLNQWLTASGQGIPTPTLEEVQILEIEPEKAPSVPPEEPHFPQEAPVFMTFEDEKKMTVTDIKRQWPPPSNASGVEIVKDIVGRPEENEMEILKIENEGEKKKVKVPKKHLYDDGVGVAEKVRACQSIVHELKASSENDDATQSKAQKMFTKRKQRSAKYVVSSPGPEVCADSEPSGQENGDPSKITHKVRNPLGDVHDFQQMKKEYGDIVTNIASAEKCQEISQALKSQTSSSKGAEMFGKRKQKAEDWVVDENPTSHPPASFSSSHTSASASVPDSPCSSKEEAKKFTIGAGLPPIPVPLDSLRPSRRTELERIASPTPILEWAQHDRHERLFSPIPFSTRIRAPSVERIIFSPVRPFSPATTSDQPPQPPMRTQASFRSSSIVNDRFESDPSTSTTGPHPPAVSRISGSDRKMLPPRMNSFNTLPRGWKSFSDNRQTTVPENTRPSQ